ncbi:NmrA family transcriptional regulator [Dactylosporangium sp. AC04546]|uniref:NmrA family transcriptional regulator n=1 Tax=Dactylosporangium sp. AC04546 TaxID=2862460 RepID=UPI001EE14905|nr:NmrA family transcriptional regulator [Dactylosporangium sp. AC04546]WVK89865.1 NmrA family transcriptional regulator [Dactylosporangium sp. AC04546]
MIRRYRQMSMLVIGATGKTGRRVAQRLAEAGVAVRGVSRPVFDWERRETWAPALTGVSAAYVTYSPDLAAPGAAEAVEAFVKTATDAGVDRLVLLSGRGEAGAERCEQLMRASDVVLRASWFNQNFSEGHLLDSVLSGVIALPAGEVAEPFTDVDDIADVAVAALTEDRHAGRLYELTGPRLLTFADAAAEIAEASGRDVAYVSLPAADFHAALVPTLGPALADLLTALCEEVFDGRNASLTDGVQEALGRAPRDFADFCAAAVASGAWAR